MKFRLLSLSALTIAALATQACTPKSKLGSEYASQTFIHKYGIIVTSEDWEKAGCNGQVVTNFKDGMTIIESYAGAELQGPTTYTFPNSPLIAKTEAYENGKCVKKTIHHSNSVPMEEIAYISPTQVIVTRWYFTGTPESVEKYDGLSILSGTYYTPTAALEGQVIAGNGTRVVRNAEGALVHRETMAAGQLTTRTEYYPNGVPQSMTSYQNGKVHGTRKTFLENGGPKSIEQWANGEQNGITTLFSHGEKVAEESYSQGQKTGSQKIPTKEEIAFSEEEEIVYR